MQPRAGTTARQNLQLCGAALGGWRTATSGEYAVHTKLRGKKKAADFAFSTMFVSKREQRYILDMGSRTRVYFPTSVSLPAYSPAVWAEE